MQLAVAATAPFGADVLERLAARHEITALLSRTHESGGAGHDFADDQPDDIRMVQCTFSQPAEHLAQRRDRAAPVVAQNLF